MMRLATGRGRGLFGRMKQQQNVSLLAGPWLQHNGSMSSYQTMIGIIRTSDALPRKCDSRARGMVELSSKGCKTDHSGEQRD